MKTAVLVLTLFVSALFFGAHTSSAAVSTTELQTVVKLQIYNDKDIVIGTSSGIQLDHAGHILTSYNAIRAWEKFKKQSIAVCPTTSGGAEPLCNWRSVVVKTNTSLDLALLQVRSIRLNEQWMTPEEAFLRSSFSFSPLSNVATSTQELVNLGDTLWLLSYLDAGGKTITTQKSSVTGFTTRAQGKKDVPWQIKSDTLFTAKQTGGGAFDEQNRFVGIPTFTTTTTNQYGAVIGVPTINNFLREALGNAYAQLITTPKLSTSTEGVMGGYLPTGNPCPEFSDYQASSKTCKCREGSYAFGGACVTGPVYCPLRFPKRGAYDAFLKSCQCPNASGGTSVCATPKPAISTAKPAATPLIPTSTIAILKNGCKTVKNGEWNTKATSCTCKKGFAFNDLRTACVADTPKPISCPKRATLDSKTTSCTCEKPFTMNADKTSCMFVGAPTKLDHLAACAVIGKNSTKLYYLPGHALIKQMTYKGKTCFDNEASAQKAKFKKAK